jgi:hypothetical protein
VSAAEVVRVVKDTPDRWFVHSRSHRWPKAILLTSFKNRDELAEALLEFARVHQRPVEASPVYREMTGET